jgi:hypothetical protein
MARLARTMRVAAVDALPVHRATSARAELINREWSDGRRPAASTEAAW